MNTQHPNREFNATDRCDRCEAQALSAYCKDDLELLFCLHHAKQHNVALEAEGWFAAFDFSGIERLVGNDNAVLI